MPTHKLPYFTCNDTQFPCDQNPKFAEELSRVRHGGAGSLKRQRAAFPGEQAVSFMTSGLGRRARLWTLGKCITSLSPDSYPCTVWTHYGLFVMHSFTQHISVADTDQGAEGHEETRSPFSAELMFY